MMVYTQKAFNMGRMGMACAAFAISVSTSKGSDLQRVTAPLNDPDGRVESLVANNTPPATIDLSEIKPGMRGEWRTVVSGSRLDTFELEVIGIAENFVGPRRSVILARALDDSQLDSGPVAGMSGSPVYIDGRLAGAYAYGFTWPKKQTLIGITPIAEMFEVLEKDELEPPRTVWDGERRVGGGGRGSAMLSPIGLRLSNTGSVTPEFAKSLGADEQTLDWVVRYNANPLQTVLEGMAPLNPTTAASSGWRLRPGALDDLSTGGYLGDMLQPLRSPIYASGVSAEALALFAPAFSQAGIEVMRAPLGSASKLDGASLEPGAPVAGVFMSGDFNFAGVGTVTWRDGDRLLAFGHPFNQSGRMDIPMAPAEIVTVVQTLPRSFKLSNVGEIVGGIYQDRLTAIAGKVGMTPPMAPVSFKINAPGGVERSYSGNLYQNKSLSPMIGAVSLFQSLQQTMEFSEEQTLFVSMKMDIAGQKPLVMKDVATGPGGVRSLAIGFMSIYGALVDNPFEPAEVTAIEVEVETVNAWLSSSIENVRMLTGTVREGEPLRLEVTLSHYLGESERVEVEIPIPMGLGGEMLDVFIGDGMAADFVDNGAAMAQVDTLEGLIEQIGKTRSTEKIYVKLLRRSSGLRVAGESFFDLPISIRSTLSSQNSGTATQTVRQKTVWENELPAPGQFRGRALIPVAVAKQL